MMEEEQVIYVVVDENTNQAQQVQIINGQPHLVYHDENGQAVIDGQQLVVEDENGEQMVIGGGSGDGTGHGQQMIVMQEDGTPVVTDNEGNIIQQDILGTNEAGKFILGADGSISLDQLGQVQSITPVTAVSQVSEPAPQKAHPKFVVTSSGLQIQSMSQQSQQTPQPTTNGSAVTSGPKQVSLLRQAFDNAATERQAVSQPFVTMAAETKPPISATITIPAPKAAATPAKIEAQIPSNGHTVITSAETTPLVMTGPSTVDPSGPGPEFMETDEGGETPQAETPQAETPQGETPQAETPQGESAEVHSEVHTEVHTEGHADIPTAVPATVPAEVMGEEQATENIGEVVHNTAAVPEEEPKESSMMDTVDVPAVDENDTGTADLQEELAPVEAAVQENLAETETKEVASTDEQGSDAEVATAATTTGPSLIISVKKVGEEDEASDIEEPLEAGEIPMPKQKQSTKPGLNDSTSSFKTGEYIGNSEDDDDPADYYQNVDPIDSYLTARDEEDGIPCEPLAEPSPQKEPIDYEAVFPSPVKARVGDSTASDGERKKGRGRPPKKLAGASPRVSSASDSEPNANPSTPSKRSQRQSKSIYRRAQHLDQLSDGQEADKLETIEPSPEEVENDNTPTVGVTTVIEITQPSVPVAVKPAEPAVVSVSEPVKRGRGRPKKVVKEAEEEETENTTQPQGSLSEKEETARETPTRRGRSKVQSEASEVSETDDSLTEGTKSNFKRVGAIRLKDGVQMEKLPPTPDNDLEEGEIDMSEIDMLGESKDMPEDSKAEEEYEPQPGTSREISRSGRQRPIIHYAELAGSTDLDSGSEPDDSDESEESPQPVEVPKEVVPVKRGRGRPKKSEAEKKSPVKTYERRIKEASSPVRYFKSPVTKSPLAAKTTIGKTSARFVSDITKDSTPWKGDLASLRKEMEGLRNTNERLQTQLEMTQQSVKAHDVKELHTRIEKLQALNTELKVKLKDAESKSSSGNLPKFSLNLGLFKGPKFDKFTVKKSGTSQGSGSAGQTKDNSQEGKGSEARVLAHQKDQIGVMNKDLKNREQLIEKREHRARTLDQELDDRSCQLKVKEAKLGRWEQKLKSQEKELEYRERNVNSPQNVVENGDEGGRPRQTGGTEKKLREMLAKKESLDSLETKIKEREKELKAADNALKNMKKRIEAKEKELNKREAEVNKKEMELQGKDQLLMATEQQLTALGQELSQKFEYLRSKEQNLSSDDEEASTKAKSDVKSKGATAQFEKEKDALLQKITEITDKNKTVRSSSVGPLESKSPLVSPRGRGRPPKNSPAVARHSSTGSIKRTSTPINKPAAKAKAVAGAAGTPSPRGRGRPRKSDVTPKAGSTPKEDNKPPTPKPRGRPPKAAQSPADPVGVIRKLHKSEASTLRLKRKRKGSAPEPVKLTKIRKRSL